MEKIINDKILERLITIANNNLIEEKHCSYCKYFYCNNASMFCSHPTKCHKITAKRKTDVNILRIINKIFKHEEDYKFKQR